jgi:hypothetical protein
MGGRPVLLAGEHAEEGGRDAVLGIEARVGADDEAPDRCATSPGEEQRPLAVGEERMARIEERGPLGEERRDEGRVASVDLPGEAEERAPIRAGGHLGDRERPCEEAG